MAKGQPPNEDFTVWMTIAVLAMTGLAILVIVIFRLAIVRVLREKERRRQAELEHQQKLLYNSLNVQERERQRIAANLHDELSSRLSILKLSLHQLEREGDKLPEPIIPLLQETLRLSRNMAHELYPPLLAQLGLAETLRDYLVPLRKELQTELRITQKGPAPGHTVSLQLFRLIQELIQNTLKHAEATRISLHLRITRRCTALWVGDNGKGFDPSETRAGLGLGSIESRVQLLEGRYRIKSNPQKGTSTLILIVNGNH